MSDNLSHELRTIKVFLILSNVKKALVWVRCRSNFLLILQDQTAITKENSLFILITDLLMSAFQYPKLAKRGEQKKLISCNIKGLSLYSRSPSNPCLSLNCKHVAVCYDFLLIK